MPATRSSQTPVAAYVAELGRALVGPGRTRKGLLQEATDHLTDATEAYVEAGYLPHDAETLAVRDFGSVDEVAPAFQTTLAVAAARRTAVVMFAALVFQPLLWDGGLRLSDPAAPGPVYAVLDVGIEVVGMLVMVGAVLALLAAGIGNRWRAAGRRLARLTGWFTLVGCTVVPVLAVSMIGVTGQLDAVRMWGMVTIFLLVPMALAASSARRCLAAC